MNIPAIFNNAPRYIPRKFMPQVDESNLTALITALEAQSIAVELVTVEPTELHYRQTVGRLHDMPAESYCKPILISADHVVLDGNHRAALHHKRGDACAALKLSVPFIAAIDALFSFTGTSTIKHVGD